jgi:CHAD domain-containing protein
MAYSYTINNKQTRSSAQFLHLLLQNFSLLKESKQYGPCYYFDTFDWRLYRQGYYLYYYCNFLFLYQHQKKKIEEKQEYHFTSLEKFFLNDGIIQKKVDPIIGIRTLMCKVTFQLTNQIFRILNSDDKTIARIKFEQCKIKDKTTYKFLSPNFEIRPLRGYANHVPGVLKKLAATDFIICREDLLTRGLAVIGKKTADYSSKLNIQLTKRMSASDAAKQIYLYLINIIQSNESGIIDDIDTEFLHDFRVSIRRTRSALGQIKGVLDENIVIKAKEDFSFLGKSTNELRDIDVYLLREEQYKLMLPAKLRKYLMPFFNDLHEQRKIEHRALVTTLKSAKYKRIISNWKTYVQLQNAENIRNLPSARLLAQTIIMKRNKKVLKFGQQIIATGSDELLHQLRIEGKKLRYLLEFFSSLFIQQKIQYLIGKLKLLQDNLGEFNDLVVQQKKLHDSTKDISLRNKTGKNVVLTLGILIGKLNEKQQRVKKDYAKIFSGYSDIKVQKIFDELFTFQGRRVR